MSRLDEIRARVEAATPGPWAYWTDEFDVDEIKTHDGLVNIGVSIFEHEDAAFVAASRDDVPYLLGELAQSQKHANDLGDLLAKVEQERDEARATIATLRQECYDRMEVCIDPSCTYKETLLGVYCQEVVLAILEGDTNGEA